MTTAEGDPPAGGGGHAWDRLREQRAKDLGEDPGPDAAERDPEATNPGDQDEVDDPDQPDEDE
jgi:hypothetical protein